MTTEQMVERMVTRLNRSTEDDLFLYPQEYYQALTDAHRRFYQKIAEHRPEVLYTDTTKTSSDGGATFSLGDDHYGELLLYRSPGPPTGRVLIPSTPEGAGNYWLQGQTIHMHVAYNGTLYVKWVPATIADLDEDTDSLLPSYCDEAVIWWACYLMAMKPGFLGDPAVFKANADREWRGDPEDPSDQGILGVISRQSAYQAWEGANEVYEPWYRGMGNL